MEAVQGERLTRGAKTALARALWWSIGRRNLVRLGRFLSNEARLDLVNDMPRNGELLVQRTVLARYPASEPLHCIDVGGNVGDWSAHLLAGASEAGRPELHLHVLEPDPEAYARLERRLASPPAGARVELCAMAASSAPGEGTLHVVGDAAAVNSLHHRYDGTETASVKVALTTLDAFCAERGIARVGLVKCDAEGHDAEVIAGARSLLSARQIDVFQFEYSSRWIDSRHYLRDIFEIAQPLSYRLGKVTPGAIEFYRAWHPELETFREGNYLLCSSEAASWFPTIAWWGDD